MARISVPNASRHERGRCAIGFAALLALLMALVAPSSAAAVEAHTPGSFLAAIRPEAPSVTTEPGISHWVQAPSWWQGGTCDPLNAPGSHPIGASWHGLVACGPGPTQGGSDHLVHFFPNSWGEFEWECVELSMRWMYLAWGVNPYPADGWDVVRDYNAGDNKAVYNPDGPDLVVVRNGTVGAVPQPGDVVSVGRTPYDSFGHTAVVTANAVDREGNGTITLIQQNGGAGNNGWVSYPVDKWVVGYGVTSWLHNPSWTAQWPLVGYNGPEGFEARVAAPGNSYEPIVSGATSIAVAGDIGSGGANGEPIYGYLDQNGEFRVRRASSPTWSLVATRVQSMALAETASGSPVLGFLSKAGDFYAEAGSLRSHFTLEARGVASIALAGGGGTASPLLGFVQSKTNAFLVKLGVAGNSWTVAQPWGVRSIALAEGTTASSLVLGYLSTDGSFLAKVGSGAGPWTKEATGASNISVAAIGPTGAPLLGYLARGAFYAAEAVAPSSWTKAASGVADMAVAAGSSAGALPVLSYLTMTGTLELMQGRIGRSFSLQAHGVSSMVISSVTDS